MCEHRRLSTWIVWLPYKIEGAACYRNGRVRSGNELHRYLLEHALMEPCDFVRHILSSPRKRLAYQHGGLNFNSLRYDASWMDSNNGEQTGMGKEEEKMEE